MKLVRPPLRTMREVLGSEVHQTTDVALDVYCAENVLLREFFWMRLWLLVLLMGWFSKGRKTCLDFGGGSGVLIPSLRTGFDRVSLIDINATHAETLMDLLQIRNVSIVKEDITAFDFPDGSFDAIVAADVLEHFQTLATPVAKIRKWLGETGYLFTSLPTENFAYQLLRRVFGKQKPDDHYHSARDVEDFIKNSGFKKVLSIYHPLFIPVLPLFRISVWKKAPD